ncbi:MAG: cysteine-rich small domain-containing protein [Bilophila wadsworthia]
MKNSSRFFRNTSCAHFPCHPNADPETFNRLFCYCPPFPAGMHRHAPLERERHKGLHLCRVPHQPDNYDRIIQKLSAAIRERAAEGKEKGPRQPTE